MANKKSAMRAKNKKSLIDNDSLSGFTIIEVVLVLAIAGLIFMMVFIALPQLQRAQRDTQRRTNLSAFQSAVTQFQANNNGKIPGQTADSTCTASETIADMTTTGNDACRLIVTYLNSANSSENVFVDPDGNPYNVKITKTIEDVDTLDHTIYMFVKAKCDGETATAADNPRDFAVLYKLEGSGTYCSDNQ